MQGAVLAAAGTVTACLWLLVSGLWWLLPAVPALAAALLWAGLRYRRAWLRRYRCLLLPDGLRLRDGVWWRREVFVPRARVQHTEVHEGPLLRRFGMAALKVFTAGTRMAELDVRLAAFEQDTAALLARHDAMLDLAAELHTLGAAIEEAEAAREGAALRLRPAMAAAELSTGSWSLNGSAGRS